jgi:hypothetical protein
MARSERGSGEIDLTEKMIDAGAAVLRCQLADLSEGWARCLAREVLEAAFGTPSDESCANY